MQPPPPRVIVALDDDLRVRESIESLFESAGHQTALFSSAEEFLQCRTRARASCVITDVRMQDMDGIELQRRIRAVAPKLPVIFISAHVSEEDRQLALDDGAIDFLYKPFDGEELLRVVETALKQFRQTPEMEFPK